MNLLFPNASVTSTHLAHAMFEAGFTCKGEQTFENKAIRSLHVKKSL